MEIKSILAAGLNEAKKSDVRRGKIGAILYTDSYCILARAHNQATRGCKSRTIHAEDRLMSKALKTHIFSRYRGNLNVLVTRWRISDNKPCNAMPCHNCYSILKQFPVNIYFTNYNGEIIWLP